MAQGDAMVLETENLTEYGGMDTDGGSGVATGWAASNYDAHVTAQTDSIETSLQRTGAGCQKTVITTDATSYRKFVREWVALSGRSDLNALGHAASVFKLNFYGRRGATDNAEVMFSRLEACNAAGAVLETTDSSDLALTTAWQLKSISLTVNEALVTKLRLTIWCGTSGAKTSATYYIDDVALTEWYTFSKNPSMPEAADVDRETKTARLADRTLKSFTYPNTGYKYTGKLVFGMITEAQMLALRSLYLWDKALTFTPNLNKLPTTLTIRLARKFSFNHISENLGAGYRGTLEWEEV